MVYCYRTITGRLFLLFFVIFLAGITNSYAQPSVTAASTPASCPGNGTITATVSGGTAPYQYRLTAGFGAPSSYPTAWQSSNTFSSLNTGSYTIEVSDATNLTATTSVNVGNTYTPMTNVNATQSLIFTGTCATRLVTVSHTGGRSSFTYELLGTTNYGPQPSNVFPNVALGNYTIRVTDACSEIRTGNINVTLQDDYIWNHANLPEDVHLLYNTSVGLPYDSTKSQFDDKRTPYLVPGSCDTITFRIGNLLDGASGMPSSNTINRRVYIKDLNTNIIIFDRTYKPNDYSGGLPIKLKTNTPYRYYFDDLCNSLDSTDRTYSDFVSDDWALRTNLVRANCNTYYMEFTRPNNFGFNHRYAAPSDTITIISSSVPADPLVGQTVIFSSVDISQNAHHWPRFYGATPGATYQYEIKNQCTTYTALGTVIMPTPFTGSYTNRGRACKQNTASGDYSFNNFPAAVAGYLKYTINSGPPSFTDANNITHTITYPVSDSSYYYGLSDGNNVRIFVRNFPEGAYNVTLTNQCGETYTFNHTIDQAMVLRFDGYLSPVTFCGSAKSRIKLTPTTEQNIEAYYYYVNVMRYNGSSWIDAGNRAWSSSSSNIQMNLDAGLYKVSFLGGTQLAGNGPVKESCDTLFSDTIRVSGYQVPVILPSSNGFVCTPGGNNGTAVIHASLGIKPYTYQIVDASNNVLVSQTDSIFTGLSKATYRFRIIDSCGNGVVQQLTIDTLLNPNIIRGGDFCLNNNSYLYSPTIYPTAEYNWTGPGGFTSNNDTVFFNPLTPADIGTYTLTQTIPGCATPRITSISVKDCNNFPVAHPDAFITDEDIPIINATVAGNDVLSGDGGNNYNISCAECKNVSNGTLNFNANGTFDYYPNANFHGRDTLIYQICDVDNDCDTAMVIITVNSVNDVPVANPDVITINEDAAATEIPVLTNDDFGGDGPCTNCTITITDQPNNGTAIVDDGGTSDPGDDKIIYTPNPDFNGLDTLIYQICDSNGDCDTAMVVITVTPVNDLPVANPDVITINEDAPATDIPVLTNDDFGGDGPCTNCTITITDQPNNGTAIVDDGGTSDPGDDKIIYTPNPDFNGLDTLIYQICDSNGDCDTAMVVITVTPVNDLPVANPDVITINEDAPATAIPVLSNDSFGGDGPCTGCAITITDQPNNGTATVNNNGTPGNPTDDRIMYTPNPNFNGLDTLIYQICDSNGDCDTAMVVINVLPVVDILTINCPAPLTVNCAGEVPAADISSVVITRDDCRAGITVQHLSDVTMQGICASRYTIQRTYVVTDGCGNRVTCTQIITVNDQTSPVLTGATPQNLTGINSCTPVAGPTIAQLLPLFTDNCPENTLTVRKDSSTVYRGCIWETTFTYYAMDGCGNTSAAVTITYNGSDQTAPVITAPMDATYSCGELAPAMLPLPAADNCDVSPKVTMSEVKTTDNGPNDYVLVRSWTAADLCGNNTTVQQTITVKDVTAPRIISCANPKAAFADGNCGAVVPAFTGDIRLSDDCKEFSPATITQIPAAGTVLGIGVHTITITATDGSGNSSTCTTTFTIKDITPPVITACAPPRMQEVTANGCSATVPDFRNNITVSDNCTPQGQLTITQQPVAGTVLGIGTHGIIITVTDANGNSSYCTTNFEVKDSQKPTISCGSDISSAINAQGCKASISVPVSALADNCSVAVLTWVMTGATTGQSGANGINYLSQNTLFNTGVTTVIYTVFDRSGNSSSCSFKVTVQASTLVAIASGSTTCAGGQGLITVSGSGGKSPYQYSIDGGAYQSGNVFTAGIGTHNITIMDANGCAATTTATITEGSNVTATTITTNVSCSNASTLGSITVTATGGAAPYQYSNNNGNSYQSSNVFTNLGAGQYTIKVKDANGCTATVIATVQGGNTVRLLELSAHPVHPKCNETTGSITTAARFSGGIGQLTIGYSWYKDGAFYSSNPNLLNVAPGNYRLDVTVSDEGSPCINRYSTSTTILAGGGFTGTVTGSAAVACNSTPAPVITFSATGGTAPYTYTYTLNGGAEQTISGGSPVTITQATHTAGTYNYRLLSVTDASGCTQTVTNTSATVVVSCGTTPLDTIPDVSPVITILPAIAHGITQHTAVIDVHEVNGVNTKGLITVYVSKDDKISMNSWVSSATTIGGTPVNNSAWALDATSNNSFYIFTTQQVIPGFGKLSFGYPFILTPGQRRGHLQVTSTIKYPSGGENRVSNNVDAEGMDYFIN